MDPKTVRRGAKQMRALARRADELEPTMYVRELLPGDNGEIPQSPLEEIRDALSALRKELRSLERDLRKDASEFDRRASIIEKDLEEAREDFLTPPEESDTIWGTISNAVGRLWDFIWGLGVRGFKFMVLDDLLKLVNQEYQDYDKDGDWELGHKETSLAEKALILAAWGIPIPGGRFIGRAGARFIEAVAGLISRGFRRALELLQRGDERAAIQAIREGLERVLRSAAGLSLTIGGRAILAARRLERAARSHRTIAVLESRLATGSATNLGRASWVNAIGGAAANLAKGNRWEAFLGLCGLKRVSVLGRTLSPQDAVYDTLRRTLQTERQRMLMDSLAMGANAIQAGLHDYQPLADRLREVEAELELHRNELSEAAYRDMKALAKWYYSDSPGDPPIVGTTSVVDTSAADLHEKLMNRFIEQQQSQL